MHTAPSRHILRQRLRQLILMRETGPKRPAWHLRRMQLIWGLHDALAALDGGLTPEFPQTLVAYMREGTPDFVRQFKEFSTESNDSKAAIDRAAEWVARWGRQRNWELTRWKDASAPDSVSFRILGKAGPRILLVGHHDDTAGVARAGIIAAMTAMAALEECGGLGDIGCITLLSGGDGTTDRRVLYSAVAELGLRHDCVVHLGAIPHGAVHISATAKQFDVCASLLQQLSLAVGVEAREISAITLAHEPILHLPGVTGLGPAQDDTPLGIDEQSIAPQTALLALFCARYATVFAH
jgi:hypothetical protein